MTQLIRNQSGFFSIYLLFILSATLTISMYSKIEIHAYMNTWNKPLLDSAMVFATHLAEGISIALILLIALSYKIQAGLFVGLSAAVSGLITQLLKRNVFNNFNRPSRVFQDFPEYALQFVDGYELHEKFSFPSGHTTAAFALMLSLSLIVNKPKFSALFGLLAVIIGYSRIYLSQHFLQDILAGSFIGASITCLMYVMFYRKSFKAKWINYGWNKNIK